MNNIIVRAKNNLDAPIRLTLTNSGYKNDHQILITIGKEGTQLKDYYNICIDTDLPNCQEWVEVGHLNIETESRITLSGKP